MFRLHSGVAVIAALVVCLSGAVAPAWGASPTSDVQRALRLADDLSLAFEHASGVVAPSVVNVRSVTRIAQSPMARRQPFISPFENSPFRDFFDDRMFPRFRVPAPAPRGDLFRQGQGTGFIVSEDGYILTNNHVVARATGVSVQLSTGEEYEAEIVGADPSTDLALLKIDAGGLEPVVFGDSDALRVGSWVVAVGNPFGLESTITAGIVSAKGRSRVGIADYEDFIQTDAAINPGNSGGPLVNLYGEVVGVNTAIATRSGGNMGIGFAIPSALAVSIMENLRDDGVVTRGWLGVGIQDLSAGLAESFGYHGEGGVLISHVEESGPADRAGLRVGDIVTTFDGERVDATDQFRLRVAGSSPGSDVEMRLFRNGREITRDVEIGELETAPTPGSSDEANVDLGLELRDLDSRTAQQLGLDTVEGVLVTSVDPLSAAARAGLRPRDVITHVQGMAVSDVRAFAGELRRHDLDEGVRLTVFSGAMSRFVFLRR